MRTSDEVIFMPMNCANKCTVKSYYKSVVIYLFFSNPKPSLFIPFLFLFNLLSCFYLSQQSGSSSMTVDGLLLPLQALNHLALPSQLPNHLVKTPTPIPVPISVFGFFNAHGCVVQDIFGWLKECKEVAAEDNVMTLEEFLAKARAGPLEEEVDSLHRACLGECLHLESHLATKPLWRFHCGLCKWGGGGRRKREEGLVIGWNLRVIWRSWVT